MLGEAHPVIDGSILVSSPVQVLGVIDVEICFGVPLKFEDSFDDGCEMCRRLERFYCRVR